MPNADKNPVIIIPGITGSRLVDKKTGKMLWGAITAKQVIFLSERSGIILPVDSPIFKENRDSIISKGIVDKYELPIGIIQFKVYRELLDMLENVGYRLGDIKNPKPEDNLYVFDYDWRRDNVENAKILADTIEKIKKATGRSSERFTLICHSMGGLLARYYLRYGGEDVLGKGPNFRVTWKGAIHVKRLILIGIPNLGSMPVFKIMHKGLDLMIVNYPPHIIYTMPSLYQLIPARSLSSFVDAEGRDLNVDLYDAENWKKYGWSVYSDKMTSIIKSHYRVKYKTAWEEKYAEFEIKRDIFVKAALERADLFHKSLSFRPERGSTAETILFGGDTEWTLDKAILKKDKHGKWRTSFWDPRIKDVLLKPGDGMVTRESLLGFRGPGTTSKAWQASPMDISFSLFVTQRHENIHKDMTFENNLLHILLSDTE